MPAACCVILLGTSTDKIRTPSKALLNHFSSLEDLRRAWTALFEQHSFLITLLDGPANQSSARFSKGGDLSEAFRKRFGHDIGDLTPKDNHQIVIVAASLDASSERIVGYGSASRSLRAFVQRAGLEIPIDGVLPGPGVHTT